MKPGSLWLERLSTYLYIIFYIILPIPKNIVIKKKKKFF